MSAINGRRWARVALVVAIAAAFASRGEAQQGVAVDVEAAPYLGGTSGYLNNPGCGFAPRMGTRFAGVGARVQVRRLPDRTNRTVGFTATAQGAVESQSNSLISPGSGGEHIVPADQAMAAGSLAIGYDWRLFGFHVGGGARETYGPAVVPCHGTDDASKLACSARTTYPETRVAFYPEIELRVGPSDGWHGVAAVGAYTPTMVLRPGLHAGVGYTTRAGHDLGLHCGLQVSGDAAAAARCDLSGAWPVSRSVSLGLGAGVVNNEPRVDFDGRASITFRFGP